MSANFSPLGNLQRAPLSSPLRGGIESPDDLTDFMVDLADSTPVNSTIIGPNDLSKRPRPFFARRRSRCRGNFGR